MKWVVLGDIGRSDFYHLGDEAMTEVAVEMLTERGASEVTLVCSDVRTAQTQYGLPAVNRYSFEWDQGREYWESFLEQISLNQSANRNANAELNAALKSADFALIAGGGNMNSQYPHLLYERLAFARSAKNAGTPLYITSQTVGPVLRERDAELVSEIVDISVCFGARERETAKLLRGLVNQPEKVVHTFDDAVLLRAEDEDREDLERFGVRERTIIASFTEDSGTSGMSDDVYVKHLVELLDKVAEDNDATIALVPHAGALGADRIVRDQLLNSRIAAMSTTGKIFPAPMPTARQNVAIVEQSIGSLSSRYHPVVFGPQAGVPTVGVSLSTYSSVRMRGALGNVGCAEFVVPSVLWRCIPDAVSEALGPTRKESRAQQDSIDFQSRWWEALVDAAKSGVWSGFADLSPAQVEKPQGLWSLQVEAVTPTFDLLGERTQRLEWAHEDLEATARWQERALRAERRKVVRLVDGFARVLRRN